MRQQETNDEHPNRRRSGDHVVVFLPISMLMALLQITKKRCDYDEITRNGLSTRRCNPFNVSIFCVDWLHIVVVERKDHKKTKLFLQELIEMRWCEVVVI